MQRLMNGKGISTRMAPYDIIKEKAEQLLRNIDEAIKDCACVVLMLSDVSQNSGGYSEIIECAISHNKPVFSVRLEDIVLNDRRNLKRSAVQIAAKTTPKMKLLLAGVAVYINGDSPTSEPFAFAHFSGKNSADGKLNGRLVFKYTNGNVYDGEWKYGMYQGQNSKEYYDDVVDWRSSQPEKKFQS